MAPVHRVQPFTPNLKGEVTLLRVFLTPENVWIVFITVVNLPSCFRNKHVTPVGSTFVMVLWIPRVASSLCGEVTGAPSYARGLTLLL